MVKYYLKHLGCYELESGVTKDGYKQDRIEPQCNLYNLSTAFYDEVNIVEFKKVFNKLLKKECLDYSSPFSLDDMHMNFTLNILA